MVNKVATQNRSAKTTSVLIILLASLILLPALLFMLLYSATPGDDTQLAFTLPPPAAGLILERIPSGNTEQFGDTYILAIEGRPIDDLLLQLLKNPLNEISPSTGSLNYIVAYAGNLQVIRVNLSLSPLWAVIRDNWSFFLSFLFLLTVSFLVFLRRPQVPAARVYFLLSSTVVASGSVFYIGVRTSDLLNGPIFWLWMLCIIPLYGLLVGGVLHFALVFPQPRASLQKRPVLLPLAYLIVWLPYLALLLLLWPVYPSPSQHLNLLVGGTGLMTLTGFSLAILVSILGYRQSFSIKERRQTRWVLWGILVATVPWLVIEVAPSLLGKPTPNLPIIGVLWWAIPISFAIAILRENLFDIDIIIRRTLVYGALTLTLGLIYFGDVLVLQWLLQTLTGQSQSPVVIVISTLAIAALFNPLRKRIQNNIDRRFYRRKYDVDKMLEAFAAQLRHEVDLDEISQSLLAVAAESMQPENARLWLRDWDKVK
jgi:hypothetical protein